MTPLMITQVVIDLLLLLVVVILLIKSGNKEKEEPAPLKEDLQNMAGSLREILDEAEEVSLHITEKLAEEKRFGENLKRALDEKIERLDSLLKKAESLAPDPGKIPPRSSSSSPDRYEEVALLADQGLSIEEISQKTRIPFGEVELFFNLHKR